ncbi:MAG TPA: hypothetical protein VLO07_08005 [Thermoanaerobaculia bacterium]|nr:hypothetical protein [Thermoanaerobaculia bacterium]
MKKMRWVALLCLVVTTASAAQRDEKADAVGQELLTSLGGPAVFEKARQFQFDFVVEGEGKTIARFSHVWDRYTGDYRLAGTEKTGAPFTVYFNVNTRLGKAFVNGRPAEPQRQEQLLKTSYERFINDTYWLLAPWKIFDPGVHLAYDGEKPCPNGGDCDVLRLSFEESVGLTPKDVYWLWISRQGRQMVAWQYVLGGAQEEPTTALWTNWKKFAGLSLSLDKPISGRPVAIRFENVSVSPARDDSLFAPPAAP